MLFSIPNAFLLTETVEIGIISAISKVGRRPRLKNITPVTLLKVYRQSFVLKHSAPESLKLFIPLNYSEIKICFLVASF